MEDRIGLINRIQALSTRTEGDIAQLQDFHVFTGHSYDRYAKMVEADHIRESVYNTRTQTNVISDDLAHILLAYLDNDLPRVVLYQSIAYFESFLFDFLEILVGQKVRREKRKVIKDLLDKSPVASLFAIPSNIEPDSWNTRGWLEFLRQTVGLDIRATDIVQLTELMATRHVWIHAAGIADNDYLLTAGIAARVAAGECLPVSRIYVYEGSDFLRSFVRDIASSTLTRLLDAPQR